MMVKTRVTPSRIQVGDLLAHMDYSEVRSVERAEDGQGWVIWTLGNLPHYYAPDRRLTVERTYQPAASPLLDADRLKDTP